MSIDFNATDADGDTLEYTLLNPHTGMSINTQTGLLQRTPSQLGHFDITLNIDDQDDNGTTTHNISITVTDTTPPLNTTPTKFILNSNIGNAVSLQLNISAVDNGTIHAYSIAERLLNALNPAPTPPDTASDQWTTFAPTNTYSTIVNYNLANVYAVNDTVEISVWFKDTADNISDVAIDSFTVVPVIFSENFENPATGWQYSNTVWQIGTPQSGPPSSHSGAQVAGTNLNGKYLVNSTTPSLISPIIQLPSLSGGNAQLLTLRFWHWFSFARNLDSGSVYVLTQNQQGDWERGTQAISFTNQSASVWSITQVDLTAFESQSLRLEFALETVAGSGADFGWYIDDVLISVVDTISITDTNSYLENFEGGFNGWWTSNGVWEHGTPVSNPNNAHSGTKIVTTVLNGNYPAESTQSDLVSPTIKLPDITIDQEINLRFWHYFNFASVQDIIDQGSVYVSEQVSPGNWSALVKLGDFTSTGNNVWSETQINLSPYKNKTVRLHLRLSTNDNSPTAFGWAIDDVSITVKNFISITSSNSYLETFENGMNGWWTTSGSWEIGLPLTGPSQTSSNGIIVGTLLSAQYSADTGKSYLISPTFSLPSISSTQDINLRFMQWFSFFPNLDSGSVYITEALPDNTWSQPLLFGTFSSNSGNVWSQTQLTITPYQNKKIRLLFNVSVDQMSAGAAGWFIDDVEIAVDEIPQLNFASNSDKYSFEESMSTWWATNGTWQIGVPSKGPQNVYSGTVSAATVLQGTYSPNITSKLVSPAFILGSMPPGPDTVLRFAHWFSLGLDSTTMQVTDVGKIYISEQNDTGEWITSPFQNIVFLDSGNIWTRSQLALTPYVGKKIRVEFELETQSSDINQIGWFLDDFEISLSPALDLLVPGCCSKNFEGDNSQWWSTQGTWEIGTPTVGPAQALSGSNVAGTILNGNHLPQTFPTILVSPSYIVPDSAPLGEVLDAKIQFQYWMNATGHTFRTLISTFDTTSKTWSSWSTLQSHLNTNSNWASATVPLNNVLGSIVRIGFEFAFDPQSCCGNPLEGVYIDDFQISAFFIPAP